MTSDAMVMDVTEDWATACHVQRRFMQLSNATSATVSCSARCRQVRALAHSPKIQGYLTPGSWQRIAKPIEAMAVIQPSMKQKDRG